MSIKHLQITHNNDYKVDLYYNVICNNNTIVSTTFIFTLKLTMSEVVIVVIVVVVCVVLICVGLCIALKKIVNKHIGSHNTKNKEEYIGLLV